MNINEKTSESCKSSESNQMSSESNQMKIGESNQMKSRESNQIKSSESNQIKAGESNQMKSSERNQTKNSESNQMKIGESNQMKTSESNQMKSSQSNKMKSSENNQMKSSESNQMKSSESNQRKTSESNQMKTSESNQMKSSESNQRKSRESNQIKTSKSNQMKSSESGHTFNPTTAVVLRKSSSAIHLSDEETQNISHDGRKVRPSSTLDALSLEQQLVWRDGRITETYTVRRFYLSQFSVQLVDELLDDILEYVVDSAERRRREQIVEGYLSRALPSPLVSHGEVQVLGQSLNTASVALQSSTVRLCAAWKLILVSAAQQLCLSFRRILEKYDEELQYRLYDQRLEPRSLLTDASQGLLVRIIKERCKIYVKHQEKKKKGRAERDRLLGLDTAVKELKSELENARISDEPKETDSLLADTDDTLDAVDSENETEALLPKNAGNQSSADLENRGNQLSENAGKKSSADLENVPNMFANPEEQFHNALVQYFEDDTSIDRSESDEVVKMISDEAYSELQEVTDRVLNLALEFLKNATHNVVLETTEDIKNIVYTSL